MTLDFTSEQHAFVDSIRAFARRECGTREQRDALTKGGSDPHNQDIYERIADLGWLGIGLPERYGGSGGGATDMCLLMEECIRRRLPLRFMSVSLIVAGIYLRFGTEAQKQEMLTNIINGAVQSIAMSEPEAGSDVANLSCRAERSGGGFIVNGHKTWITAAHKADHILLVCRTSRDGPKHAGLSMLSIPSDTEGIEIHRIDTLGDPEVNDVYFTDCFVPEDRLIGEAGRAWEQLTAGLNHERLIIAGFALGLAQRSFDDLLAYVKVRNQFGRPIGSFQSISHRIADLATEIECSRLLIYSVAAKTDADPDTSLPREASMAKLKASETAKRVALEGMQMMGGYGYTREFEMAQDVVEALPMTIYAGTSEVQRGIIARTLGLKA
jgi:alkylation response protein AidB-like acyl-CoA dehydrogenase